jgi:hypothetical protein
MMTWGRGRIGVLVDVLDSQKPTGTQLQNNRSKGCSVVHLSRVVFFPKISLRSPAKSRKSLRSKGKQGGVPSEIEGAIGGASRSGAFVDFKLPAACTRTERTAALPQRVGSSRRSDTAFLHNTLTCAFVFVPSLDALHWRNVRK